MAIAWWRGEVRLFGVGSTVHGEPDLGTLLGRFNDTAVNWAADWGLLVSAVLPTVVPSQVDPFEMDRAQSCLDQVSNLVSGERVPDVWILAEVSRLWHSAEEALLAAGVSYPEQMPVAFDLLFEINRSIKGARQAFEASLVNVNDSVQQMFAAFDDDVRAMFPALPPVQRGASSTLRTEVNKLLIPFGEGMAEFEGTVPTVQQLQSLSYSWRAVRNLLSLVWAPSSWDCA